MKTRTAILSVGFLCACAGLLIGVAGPSIAQECASSSFAGRMQPRCFAKSSKRAIVGATRTGDSSSAAVLPGPPKDGVACNGSLTVGDNVGWYGNGTPGTVTDINLIEQQASKPSAFRHHVSNVVTAGWLYRDERRNYWVQMNGRALPSMSSKTRAFFASLGLPHSGGLAFITTGRHPPDVRSAHLKFQRCWSDGKVFASAG